MCDIVSMKHGWIIEPDSTLTFGIQVFYSLHRTIIQIVRCVHLLFFLVFFLTAFHLVQVFLQSTDPCIQHLSLLQDLSPLWYTHHKHQRRGHVRPAECVWTPCDRTWRWGRMMSHTLSEWRSSSMNSSTCISSNSETENADMLYVLF